MSRPSGGNELALLAKPSLLITESADEFDALHKALEQDIKPRGVIEHIFVADISSIIWEILRLRRCQAAIINAAFCTALEQLLERLLPGPFGWSEKLTRDEAKSRGKAWYPDADAKTLPPAWFTDREAKKEVAQILGQFQLDESAIEAEAIRTVSADLEQLDRMLTSLESRRNKALRCIGEYRDSLARQLRESADRIIAGKDVLRLEHASGKRSSAA
jgi:hypothetical protein